jgi:hypothetical protein
MNLENKVTNVKPPPAVNHAAAAAFLDFLDPLAETFTAQTFDDDKSRKFDLRRARTICGPYDTIKAQLVAANRDRCAVHVTINETRGARRKGADVTTVRKHFVEIDGTMTLAQIKALPIKAAWINESSPGKYHVFFNVAVDVVGDLQGFTLRQKRFAAMYSGGVESVDLSRVLRLPGYWHQKDPAKPFQVRTVHRDDAAPYYDKDALNLLLPDLPPSEPPAARDAAAALGEDATAIEAATTYLRDTAPIAISDTNTPAGTKHKMGNSTTFDVACYCRDLGCERETTFGLMLEHYNDRCDPAWDYEALERIVANAYAYAKGTQGGKHPTAIAIKEFAAEPLPPDKVAAEPLSMTKASDVKPRNIQFVWQDRLALGKHTAIPGRGGEGKSQVVYDIAGRITNGAAWPCSKDIAPQGSVVLLNAEDDPADMMIPRLLAAGADLNRVHIVEAVNTSNGGKKRFNIQADLDKLYTVCRTLGDVVMVAVDPLGSYLGGELDTHRDAALRDALDPISQMASAANVAFTSVMHFNKSSGVDAVNRVMGGAGFVNAPRCAVGVLRDPDDDDVRLFLGLKSNIGRLPQGLKFKFGSKVVGIDDGRDIKATHVQWIGTTEVSADAVVLVGKDRATPLLDIAKEFLRGYLKDGPKLARDVEHAANAQGITPSTLRRARADMSIEGVPPTQPGGPWSWRFTIEHPDDFGV